MVREAIYLIDLNGRSPDDVLIELGEKKKAKAIRLTWDEIAAEMNSKYSDVPRTESYWRKRYTSLKKIEQTNPVLLIEEEKVKCQDERTSIFKMIRESARYESLKDIFKENIVSIKPVSHIKYYKPNGRAIYAMLSDIHYGIEFDTYAGKYNTKIAENRVMKYAHAIIEHASNNDVHECYVSLMGDLISGNIHTLIRIENQENVVNQIIGVSNLISHFLSALGDYFDIVYVNNVTGNHSRLTIKSEDSSRDERLDDLIPYYCVNALKDYSNISFSQNRYDSTIGNFTIFGKHYFCVHGDMDNDLDASASKIQRLTKTNIDYLLAGHLHVGDCRFSNIGFIRNGCVCGSGDNFTMKNRLYSYPIQICMTVTEHGIESVYPVRLDIDEPKPTQGVM